MSTHTHTHTHSKGSVFCILFAGSILEHGASFMEMTGKDSLSLNVEFIRVNISRTRKLEILQGADNSSSKLDPQTKSTVVRFSGWCRLRSDERIVWRQCNAIL